MAARASAPTEAATSPGTARYPSRQPVIENALLKPLTVTVRAKDIGAASSVTGVDNTATTDFTLGGTEYDAYFSDGRRSNNDSDNALIDILAGGEINGYVWNNVNADAVKDAGEPGLEGWTIFIDEDGNGMLDAGVYLAPSAFEAGFVSLAHTDADIDETLAAARDVMAGLRAAA